ncbi:hypothetical protein BX666DRAFT_1949100 [Dichotomocladium elegans]|nr:hypothetical protein BX666DRAFT_1949100 [Dichotomocladium elegans]
MPTSQPVVCYLCGSSKHKSSDCPLCVLQNNARERERERVWDDIDELFCLFTIAIPIGR